MQYISESMCCFQEQTGLSQCAEEKAKELDIRELIAEVKKRNRRAIEFLKRNGYVEMGDNAELATLAYGKMLPLP